MNIYEFFNPLNYGSIISILPNIVVSILILSLGAIVFFRNTKSDLNCSFFLMALSIVLWIFFHAICYITKDPSIALFWAKFSYLGVCFVSTNIYAFSVAYLNLSQQKKWVFQAYMMSSLFCLFIPTGWLIKEVQRYPWGYYPRAGEIHPILVLFFGAVFCGALFNFYRGFKQEARFKDR